MAPTILNRLANGLLSWRVLAPAGTLVACGLFLTVTAAPRLVAGIVRIGGDPGAAALERNRPAGPDLLDATIESRLSALRWYPSPQFLLDVGSAAYRAYARLRSLPVRSPDEERKYRRLAREAFSSGLAAHPSQPFAWMQLAYIDLLEKEPSNQIGPLLRMSVRTGPHEPLLIVPRVSLGLLAWDRVDVETRRLVTQQIKDAAAYRPRELADTVLRLGAEDFIRAALASRPDLLSTFEDFLFEPEEGSPLFR